MITFAIMALMIGGFTINADAQADCGIPKEDQAKVNKMLDDYDAAVVECETVYKQLQDVEKKLSELSKADNNNQNSPVPKSTMRKKGTQTRTKDPNTSESIKLQQRKKTLQNDLNTKLNNAKELQKSFNKVAMTNDQKTRLSKINNRLKSVSSQPTNQSRPTQQPRSK